MREPDRPETWGHASDNGQVYQSRANQYITHIHVAEARSRTAHEARRRADVVVQVLTRAVGEWAARCQELEEQVRQARADGHAEAQAEFAERLKDAELRVMRAQSTMRQAEQERARAEELLAQAQMELARRRREAERDAAQEREATPLPAHPGLSQEAQDSEGFSDLMERAEAELGVVREELRQLGEEIDGDTVETEAVQGEWTVRHDGQPEEPGTAGPVPGTPSGGVAPGRTSPTLATFKRIPSLGPPRLRRIGFVWLAWEVPATIPMLVVTANRAAYGTDAHVLVQALFTVGSVLAGAVALLMSAAVLAFFAEAFLTRESERRPGTDGVLMAVLVLLVLFVSAFFTPLDWPGPAGTWGSAVASLAGLE
ncbi:hypothetical protein [Streptomyces sp. SAI-229]|uniref:hypothetical protein n=1 Tax=Streptomyces sp. SAI-229 TaxID=3377731 RepID=UPI003C7A6576